MPDYKLIKDAYYGNGGFLDGSYIKRHKRETDGNYDERRELAYYFNYFSNIVNSLVDPIFRKRPNRNWEGSRIDDLIELFHNNIDNNGTDIHTFMHDAALKAKMLGAVFICVENFGDAGPGDMKTAIDGRKIPYAYIIEPWQVDDYKLDNFGRLTYLKIKEPINDAKGSVKYRTVEYTDEEIIERLDGQTRTVTTHGLGRIPIIYFPSRIGSNTTKLPESELEPIARAAKTQYNMQSWLSEILKNQTFSILTVPFTDLNELSIGSSNALGYDGQVTGGAKPEFITPPSSPADTLAGQIKAMTEEMYRMAGLSFVTGTKQEASGVAKAWEFERTNQTLATFAERCRTAEMAIMDLFFAWLREPNPEYNVEYPKDFGIVDVAAEIQTAQAVKDLDLTPELEKHVLVKVLGAYLPDLPADDFDALVEDVTDKIKDGDYDLDRDVDVE